MKSWIKKRISTEQVDSDRSRFQESCKNKFDSGTTRAMFTMHYIRWLHFLPFTFKAGLAGMYATE
ncbi:hypothetical protein Pan153_48290 [Gimesia panareensis]|uniref:Uncharacterized protein n=1 Tax=Gimesia panareensis TaxID=2527978 RepID=A0A518FUZ1_9PLAN|nr:hypothetical protein Pan153_48290 [Gimesia panareensis]